MITLEIPFFDSTIESQLHFIVKKDKITKDLCLLSFTGTSCF